MNFRVLPSNRPRIYALRVTHTSLTLGLAFMTLPSLAMAAPSVRTGSGAFLRGNAIYHSIQYRTMSTGRRTGAKSAHQRKFGTREIQAPCFTRSLWTISWGAGLVSFVSTGPGRTGSNRRASTGLEDRSDHIKSNQTDENRPSRTGT